MYFHTGNRCIINIKVWNKLLSPFLSISLPLSPLYQLNVSLGIQWCTYLCDFLASISISAKIEQDKCKHSTFNKNHCKLCKGFIEWMKNISINTDISSVRSQTQSHVCILLSGFDRHLKGKSASNLIEYSPSNFPLNRLSRGWCPNRAPLILPSGIIGCMIPITLPPLPSP